MGDMLRVTHDDSNIVDQWVGKAVGFENITHPERPWKYCVIRHANYVVLEVCVAKASEAELEEKEMMC